jgi:hypothetical protein
VKAIDGEEAFARLRESAFCSERLIAALNSQEIEPYKSVGGRLLPFDDSPDIFQ